MGWAGSCRLVGLVGLVSWLVLQGFVGLGHGHCPMGACEVFWRASCFLWFCLLGEGLRYFLPRCLDVWGKSGTM